MDEQEQAKNRAMEITRREMYRKSRDLIRVYNPLNEPFKFMWDGYTQTIPAKATKDIERYLANHYFRKISQKIIGDMQVKKANELLDDRKKKGLPDYLDKYEENRNILDKTPRLDNKELLSEIAKECILGMVEAYGMDLTEEAPRQPQADTRDIYEQIFSQADKQIEKDPLPEPALKAKPKLEELTDEN